MTTDPITREDLEMAAKAANYLVVDGADAFVTHRAGGLVLEDERYGSLWHPGNDDGDCARMCAAVGIDVMWDKRDPRVLCIAQRVKTGGTLAWFSDHANDKCAAWRYASVKLAAAVGRGMA